MSPLCCPGIGSSVLCILLLTELCAGLHQYQFVNEMMTWNDAQTYCRTGYADLATVDSEADMQQLIAAIDSGYEGEVWIGTYDVPDEWSWALSDLRYYPNNEWYFQKWGVGQPSYTRTEPRLCVTLNQGFWYDYSCNLPLPFVCYNNSNDPTLPAVSTQNYIYVSNPSSWYSARTYCQSAYTNLASVRNEEENTLVQQVMASQPALMGLYRFTWVWWSDGTPPLFANWVSGHPLANTGNCATSVINATHLGQWVEHQCSATYAFVCYNTKRQVFVVKLKAAASSAVLNDPDVLMAILNIMTGRMKDKGLRHFTFSWVKKPNKNIFNVDEDTAGLGE